MIRAVIFDMDGVLIDAKEWHYEALNQALALFGYTISRHDHETTYDGLPTKKKLELLTERQGLPRRLHHFLNEMKQQYTMDMVYQLCKPSFTHEYALAELKRLGYRLAVASNSIRQTVEIMMEKAHLTRHLDLMLSNQDVKEAKPHPEIYLTAMRQLGLQPQECVIVEDNENGIRAARASGGHVLVVRDVHEVTLDNILGKIREANLGSTTKRSVA
jgi:HAD superfamily hydrolase (TIGR01493 family)